MLNRYIKAITEDKDSLLWVITMSGNIMLLNNAYQTIRSFTPSDIDPVLKPNSYQQVITGSNNTIYVVSEKGLFISENHRTFHHINDDHFSPSRKYMTWILELDRDRMLIGTREGFLIYNKKKKQLENAADLTSFTNPIHYMDLDLDSTLYLNTAYNGLAMYKKQHHGYVKSRNFSFNINFKDCYETADILWFATTKGTLKLTKKENTFLLLDETDGLPNQNIYCVLPDPKDADAFWCSSNKGIFRYHTLTQRILSLGLNDGLESLEFNTNAFVQRMNGDYAFGSIDGLTYIRPGGAKKIHENNTIVVKNLKIVDLNVAAFTDPEIPGRIRINEVLVTRIKNYAQENLHPYQIACNYQISDDYCNEIFTRESLKNILLDIKEKMKDVTTKNNIASVTIEFRKSEVMLRYDIG